VAGIRRALNGQVVFSPITWPPACVTRALPVKKGDQHFAEADQPPTDKSSADTRLCGGWWQS
jgi:hypothetical protein